MFEEQTSAISFSKGSEERYNPGLPLCGSKEQKRVRFRMDQSEADGGVKHPLSLEKKVTWSKWSHNVRSSNIHRTTATWLSTAVVFCICRLFFGHWTIPDTHINCVKGRRKKQQDRKEKRQRKNVLINSRYKQRYGRHSK